MSSQIDFPYDTRLNVLHEPLELIDVQAVADANTHPWFNQTLTKVNDCVVRMAEIQGEYHWHHHDVEDEFFYVVEGKLIVDLDNRSVELLPRQGITVPHGVRHRTRAPEKTIILMVEGSGIVPTGD